MPSPASSTAPTELVSRPDPGLSRGLWEAPPVAFYVAIGVMLLVSLGYVAIQRGWLKRRRS